MNRLESRTTAGDSPVTETDPYPLIAYPSKAGHVQSCLNLRGPSRKAKYSLETDSGLVPRGKGEKNPCEGSPKILKPHVYKQFEDHAARQVRERTFCIMIRRLNVRGEAKPLGGAGAKASPKWAPQSRAL